LRLDRFDDAIAPRKDSPPAIVPGKAGRQRAGSPHHGQESRRHDAAVKTQKKLTAQEKALLKNWMPAARSMSLTGLYCPETPRSPARAQQGLGADPIDYFILARLSRRAFRPPPKPTAAPWPAA